MAGRAAGRAAGRVGEMENKAISASNLKLKLKLTEAELGNNTQPLFHKNLAYLTLYVRIS